MTNSKDHLGNLVERVENYCITTLKLGKYTAIDRFSDLLSTIAVCITIGFVGLLFLSFASVAFALWVGNYLGKAYYGFLIVAAVYACLTIVLYMFRNKYIKSPLTNLLIRLLQKQ